MSCADYEIVTKVYLGHDNAVTIIPYSDIVARTVYDMTSITEIQASADLLTSTITGDDVTASSDDVPVTVWWADTTGDGDWRIYLKIGLFVGMAAGEYKIRVILLDPTLTNGLVLTDELQVEVVDIP